MLSLKSQIKNLPITQFSLFLTIFMHFWIKNYGLYATMGVCFYIELVSITRNLDLEEILHSERSVTEIERRKNIKCEASQILI